MRFVEVTSMQVLETLRRAQQRTRGQRWRCRWVLWLRRVVGWE